MKTVFNVNYFDEDDNLIDSTQIDENNEELAWQLFKEFGHEKKEGFRLEFDEAQEELSDSVTKLINLRRKNWTKEDVIEAYKDEWDEIPESLEDCFSKMEEYIFHTYDEELIQQVIEDEEL